MALPDQYIGDFSDYQTGATSATVQFASCPSNAGIISQCQYNISYGCSSSEEVLTCIDRKLVIILFVKIRSEKVFYYVDTPKRI